MKNNGNGLVYLWYNHCPQSKNKILKAIVQGVDGTFEDLVIFLSKI